MERMSIHAATVPGSINARNVTVQSLAKSLARGLIL